MAYKVVKSESSTDIHILAPGVQKDTVKVTAHEDLLFVEFEWPDVPKSPECPKGVSYFFKPKSKWSEIFCLGRTVAKIDLSLKDGILVVSVFYKEEPRIKGVFADNP